MPSETKARPTVRTRFGSLAAHAAHAAGSPGAFLAAIVVILIWLATGPRFHFSDTWQLIVNTATTVVTFLMVFLIQNTQNRDARALHLKLDELIRAVKLAHNEMIDIEKLTDDDLDHLEKQYHRIRGERESRSKPNQKPKRTA